MTVVPFVLIKFCQESAPFHRFPESAGRCLIPLTSLTEAQFLGSYLL
jgi:hypothetical protein